MTYDSDSKDKKNPKEQNGPQSKENELQESNKPAPKKKKRTKDPNRHLVDLAKKYYKLSQQIPPYEDLIRKASPTYELERQLMEKHDVLRIIEESDWVHREFDRFAGQDLSGVLGLDSMTQQTISEMDRSREIFESVSRYHIDQISNYHDLLYASSSVNDIIQDITANFSWIDSIKVDPLEEAIKQVKDIIQIDVSDIFKISSDLKDFYSSLPAEDVIVQDNRIIIYAGSSYEISEINDIVYRSIYSSGILKAKRISHKALLTVFNGLKSVVDFSKRNLVKAVILYYICRVLDIPINFTADKIYGIYFDKQETTHSQVIQKPAKKMFLSGKHYRIPGLCQPMY